MALGEYRPANGLNGYIVTVDECNYVEKNGSANETVRYLQQDRLFLLRDYNLASEQVEVNIVISLMAKKSLDLEVVTKGR